MHQCLVVVASDLMNIHDIKSPFCRSTNLHKGRNVAARKNSLLRPRINERHREIAPSNRVGKSNPTILETPTDNIHKSPVIFRTDVLEKTNSGHTVKLSIHSSIISLDRSHWEMPISRLNVVHLFSNRSDG